MHGYRSHLPEVHAVHAGATDGGATDGGAIHASVKSPSLGAVSIADSDIRSRDAHPLTMQVHLSPSQNLETNGDPVGWESDHHARTALLQPGPGSWSSPRVLTTQTQIISLVTLQLPGRGRFKPARAWQLLRLVLLLAHRAAAGINMPKHAKTARDPSPSTSAEKKKGTLRQLELLRTYSRYSLLAGPLVSELTRQRRPWITLLRQRGSDLAWETRERGFPLLGPVSWVKDATAYLIKS
ncbi:hypothetical protein TRIATDRAFT_85935 [Trichoderma atroviride IMI 206040]|uniref:Uncharacterized protein n=1 Tax=Hypocrea atroviridis (strain ATCC 20476 / IMI 206040) TaxID=452589 RepID=G9P0Z7_HYPAI|nr:uncharacterized protein TRIATDRAFT_85935 [Trichoderma atroviride IMI 206040]EHK43244.1 hypothetical protein TRIATDRAFT_85935 [Trichoderma atroviride IMI 206040]